MLLMFIKNEALTPFSFIVVFTIMFGFIFVLFSPRILSPFYAKTQLENVGYNYIALEDNNQNSDYITSMRYTYVYGEKTENDYNHRLNADVLMQNEDSAKSSLFSSEYGLSPDKLIISENLANANDLSPGDTLHISNEGDYFAYQIEALVATSYGILEQDPLSNKGVIILGHNPAMIDNTDSFQGADFDESPSFSQEILPVSEQIDKLEKTAYMHSGLLLSTMILLLVLWEGLFRKRKHRNHRFLHNNLGLTLPKHYGLMFLEVGMRYLVVVFAAYSASLFMTDGLHSLPFSYLFLSGIFLALLSVIMAFIFNAVYFTMKEVV